ncbi:flagellar hook protein FlgE [Clostridium sp. UBA4548]|uniref:flagellar hook protein FlgE n=1 Tax=Clostridium sp. UBA4548 TaxID=1946361 RepID=UPI0025C04732|nr:flagellar hook-basal body complex protein [Clostridium sp. UBA4548]
MLNSMYSGISGLNANQRKLDVIGNNIANSGTTAFKASSVTFQDSMYQMIKNSSSPSLNLGGTNPSQVGLGVSVQSINVNTNQGSLQPTGRPLDLAVDQKGYFVVAKGPAEGADGKITVDPKAHTMSSSMQTSFTRDGAFKLDPYGNLLNSNGYRVMGYAVKDATNTAPLYDGNAVYDDKFKFVNPDDKDFKAVGTELVSLRIPDSVQAKVKDSAGNLVDMDIKIQSYSIEKDGIITAVLADGSRTALGQVAMVSFNNESGLKQLGQNMYSSSSNSGEPVLRSGKGSDKVDDNSKAYGDIVQGALEMSNTDLAVQFTDMIVASRSFQACSKVISTGDEILQELVNLKR